MVGAGQRPIGAASGCAIIGCDGAVRNFGGSPSRAATPRRSRHCDRSGVAPGARPSLRRRVPTGDQSARPGRWRAWKPAQGGRASPREVVPFHGRRRDGRPGSRLGARGDLTRDRWCARPRREGHREVHNGQGADRVAAAGDRGGRLPLLLRPDQPRPDLPGRSAPHRRTSRQRTSRPGSGRSGQPAHPPGQAGRTTGRSHRRPGTRSAASGTRPAGGGHRVRARPARRRAPWPALRRRGQPATRSPGGCASRRGRDGPRHGRAGGGLRRARRPVRPGGNHEPGRGRVAPTTARPVRADRRGGRQPGSRGARRGGAPQDVVRGGSGRVRGPVRGHRR